ncbi:MAG: shikimate kinase [Elusimicrobiota bacterium]|nr:shikimate kinase [Endomicrobiia bacterium]MDW8164971.1 shikimate kinase [Elusimicrobiota bacterium]
MVNIVLTGFMCTGKTSVGMKLKEILNYDYYDTDELIQNKMGLTISEIFRIFGESYFRDIESKIVKEVSKNDKSIISTGGGVVLRKENMENLRKNGIIINLSAKPETIYERLKKQPGIRPLLDKPNPLQEIRKLLKQREKYYQDCDFQIQTDNISVEKVAYKILECIKDRL